MTNLSRRTAIALGATTALSFSLGFWREAFATPVVIGDGPYDLPTTDTNGGLRAAGDPQNVTTGIELQWGKRENFKDDPLTGFNSSDDFKIQASFKYNFSKTL